MPIKFRCPSCNKKIKVRDAHAGKAGQCPFCQTGLTIPQTSTITDETESSVTAVPPPSVAAEQTVSSAEKAQPEPSPSAVSAAPEPMVQPTAAPVAEPEATGSGVAGFARFECPNCQKKIGFPAEKRGQPATCPACQAQVMVPEAEGDESFIVQKTVDLPKTPRRERVVSQRQPKNESALPMPGAGPREGVPWLLVAVGGGISLLVAIVLVAIFSGGGPQDDGSGQKQQAAAVGGERSTPASEATNSAESDADTKSDVVKAAAESFVSKPPVPTQAASTSTSTSAPTQAQASTGTSQPRPPSKPDPFDPNVVAADAQAQQTPGSELTVGPGQGGTEVQTPAPTSLRPDDDEENIELKPKPEAVPEQKDPLTGETKAPDTPPANAQDQFLDPKDLAQAPAPPAEPSFTPLSDTYRPILPATREFVWVEGQPAPPLAALVAWQYQAGKGAQADLEKEHLLQFQASYEQHAQFEKDFGSPVLLVSTHHLMIQGIGVPPAVLKQVGSSIEKLTNALQNHFKSVELTPARPHTHDLVITADTKAYQAYVKYLAKKYPEQDYTLTLQSSGGGGRRHTFFNAYLGQSPSPPDHMAVFSFGRMLIAEASDSKAPPWVVEGFAAYCENITMNGNLCYAFSYEKNEIQFTKNWNQDIVAFAKARKLQPWRDIFRMSLEGVTAVEYLTSYSMVSFLIKHDPQRFLKLVLAFRSGQDSETAVKEIYGKTPEEMQVLWAQWAIRQR